MLWNKATQLLLGKGKHQKQQQEGGPYRVLRATLLPHLDEYRNRKLRGDKIRRLVEENLQELVDRHVEFAEVIKGVKTHGNDSDDGGIQVRVLDPNNSVHRKRLIGELKLFYRIEAERIEIENTIPAAVPSLPGGTVVPFQFPASEPVDHVNSFHQMAQALGGMVSPVIPSSDGGMMFRVAFPQSTPTPSQCEALFKMAVAVGEHLFPMGGAGGASHPAAADRCATFPQLPARQLFTSPWAAADSSYAASATIGCNSNNKPPPTAAECHIAPTAETTEDHSDRKLPSSTPTTPVPADLTANTTQNVSASEGSLVSDPRQLDGTVGGRYTLSPKDVTKLFTSLEWKDLMEKPANRIGTQAASADVAPYLPFSFDDAPTAPFAPANALEHQDDTGSDANPSVDGLEAHGVQSSGLATTEGVDDKGSGTNWPLASYRYVTEAHGQQPSGLATTEEEVVWEPPSGFQANLNPTVEEGFEEELFYT